MTIEIEHGHKLYEFYDVPIKVGKAIITLLRECENNESKVLSSERTLQEGSDT